MVLHVHILEKGSFALKVSSFLRYRCQALFYFIYHRRIQYVTADKFPIGDVGYMYTHILARVNMVRINLE